MKAQEVLRRYAAGERNFQCANIRGQSFQGKDLSGANFSEADIRGTNFTHAILKGANFTKAKAGLQRRWLLFQQLSAFVISTCLVVIFVFTGLLISLINPTRYSVYPIVGLVVLGWMIVIFIVIFFQGFTSKAFGTIAISIILVVASAAMIFSANTNETVVNVAVIIGATAAVGAAIVLAIVISGIVTAIAPTATAVATAVIVAVVVANTDLATGFVGGAVAGVSFLFSIYCHRRAFKGDDDFAIIQIVEIIFRAIGGTSFRGADLSHANFSRSILKSTNFNHTKQRQTVLEWVNWQGAKKLDYARVGNSILANSAVRELLVTHDGYQKSYVAANLRATNLDGVNLEQANMTWADLTCSTLCQANLKNVNLSESLVLNTDFTGANLTGACLEAWNIDSHTNLEQVDCQYVYLLRTERERRPSSGDFAAGEFTKLFQEVLSTVDLIFRNGVDWKAFLSAFQQVQVENEDTSLEIQSIENKGDGVVVVRVSVPPDTDKTKIHSEFNQQYELTLVALEARYRSELQAKDGEIAIYREQSTNMWEVIKSQANRPITVQAIAESKSMSNSNDSSQNVNIGGNVTGSNINLGTISGNVTNTINQLPADTSDPNQPNLKVLLTQLQAAIEEDNSLPDEDKADLLGEVQNFAQAKQTEEPTKKEGLVRRAKKIFEVTLKSLPDTAKIVEASSKLLPIILKVLGFPV
jgi:uncharacterized protein YjbI with pentapeptide repeats